MKTRKLYIIISAIVMVAACKQDVIVVQPATAPAAKPGTPGTLTTTKFVAVGSSFVAGMQGGALYQDGQNNSMPAIINKQLAAVGFPNTFKQPDTNVSLGWNVFITQTYPTDPVQGRLQLKLPATLTTAGCANTPKPATLKYPAGVAEAVPNPIANPGFMYPFSKTGLNNFSVSAITLGQAMTPATGGPPPPAPNPAFNPFYMRFASSPSPDGVAGSSIVGDAKAAGGSLFLIWLGFDDFLLYAAFGGDPTKAPLTNSPTFNGQFNALLNTASPHTGLLTGSTLTKAVILNYPDIFKMPHFTAVKYNPLPLDEATVNQLSAGFGGYNAALDGLIANAAAFGISAALVAEIATRKVTYTVSCSNKFIINDETLTNLGPYFDGLLGAGAITPTQRAALTPYQTMRMTASTDVIPFSTGVILGTPVNPADPTQGVYGVSIPLNDQYALIPSEITAIKQARIDFNTTIFNFGALGNPRVTSVDISGAFDRLVSSGAMGIGNSTITPKIDPPAGIFSEDGLNFNSLGNAWVATVTITQINNYFQSTIPLPDMTKYPPTALPIP